jgi:hypothetical protein
VVCIPTVTDANLVLGFLDPSTFAGGTMTIDRAQAEASITPLAQKSGLSVAELAWGIHSVVNENMAAAARVHVAERGHHASQFALLATGGGGPLHACEVAKRLGIARVICPPSAGVASALGLLMAPARVDRVATLARKLGELDWGAFERAFRAIEQEAQKVIAATLIGRSKVTVERAADLRFVGQGFELVTTLPRGPIRQSPQAYARRSSPSTADFSKVPPVGEIEIIYPRRAYRADLPRRVEGRRWQARHQSAQRQAQGVVLATAEDSPNIGFTTVCAAGRRGHQRAGHHRGSLRDDDRAAGRARARRPRRQPARRSRYMITLPTQSERIVARKDGAIGWMIFNNPAKHNAISMDMAQAVPAVMRDFENDAGIRVIVIAGTGKKAFAAGSDISGFEEVRSDPQKNRHYNEVNERSYNAVYACAKPTMDILGRIGAELTYLTAIALLLG